MEIKINKEICAYNETLFFGLSARQFVCSILAIGTAVGIYFIFKNIIGKETASWVCIVSASPMAAMGFFKYNGLPAEKLLWETIKSEIIFSGRRVYKADNYYLYLLNIKPKKAVIPNVKDIKEQYIKRKNTIKSAKKRTGLNSHRKNIR